MFNVTLIRDVPSLYFKDFNPQLSLPRMLSSKLRKNSISFCKIVKNKQHHLKGLVNSWHSNGHTPGFRPQTQK